MCNFIIIGEIFEFLHHYRAEIICRNGKTDLELLSLAYFYVYYA